MNIQAAIEPAVAKMTELSRGPIARAAISTLIQRILNVFIGVAATFIIGRSLGAAGFGIMSVGIASAALASGLVMRGAGFHIKNKASEFRKREDWGSLNGIRRYALMLPLVLMATVAFIGVFLLSAAQILSENSIASAAMIGLCIAPAILANGGATALLLSLDRPARAYFPTFILLQSIFLVIVVILSTTGELSATTALYAFGAASIIAAGLCWFWVLRYWPPDARGVRANMRVVDWNRSVALIVVGTFAGEIFGRIETFALAEFSTAAEIGIYALAFRFAQFATFPAFALSSGLIPAISRLHAAGDFASLRERLLTATRVTTALCLMTMIGLIVVCYYLFPMINPEFRPATPVLAVHTIAYLVQAASGRSYDLLVILKHEKIVAGPGFIMAIAGIVLVVIFASLGGAMGAAIATATTLSAAALINWFLLFKKSSIRSDIFAAMSHSTNPENNR